MKNLLKTIKERFVVKEKQSYPTLTSGSDEGETILIAGSDVATEALAHYCAICKRGFKTKGARNAHNALKHKVQDLKKHIDIIDRERNDLPKSTTETLNVNPELTSPQ